MPPAYLAADPTPTSGSAAFWCVGKERFDSAILAYQAAARRENRDHYRCCRCGGFHVGTHKADLFRRKRVKGLIR